jgi:hypothetical protein
MDQEQKLNLKVYIVMSYPKGTPLIADRRAGIINSVWTNNEAFKCCLELYMTKGP